MYVNIYSNKLLLFVWSTLKKEKKKKKKEHTCNVKICKINCLKSYSITTYDDGKNKPSLYP